MTTTLIFRSTLENIQSPEQQNLTLDDFCSKRLWVAWRTVDRKNKYDDTIRPTKVPYYSALKEARANSPDTWRTIDGAAAIAKQINGSLGICLGVVDCTPGLRLGGIDLDSCRDPDTGKIERWATAIIRRFASYTEISPSGKGAKVFFLYRMSEWDQIKPIIRNNVGGRQWKRRSADGGDHPPAIELYLRCRFFAVTSNTVADYDHLRIVEPADLLWLAEDYAPRFAKKAVSPVVPRAINDTRNPTPANGASVGGNDHSNSGRAFRMMRVCHRMGKSYTEARDYLLTQCDDPGVAEWAATKGMARGEYEMRRAYYRAQPSAGSVDDRIGEMAREFAKEGLDI